MENPVTNDEYILNPIHDFCNTSVNKLLIDRISDMPIEERLDGMAYSQMFSFWAEIQTTLLLAKKEISDLKQKIKELENNA